MKLRCDSPGYLIAPPSHDARVVLHQFPDRVHRPSQRGDVGTRVAVLWGS